MAGSQDPNENPVAINVVPLVDIIFCLCVFFMCSFKFKQLEGKFDSWLPTDKGTEGLPSLDLISEVRVALLWDANAQMVHRKMGVREIPQDDDLQKSIAEAHQAWVQKGKPDAPVTIDADPAIPWNEVINVVNIVKRCGIEKIEFAMGAKPEKPKGAR
jgi:biopolymer transport protein ExbD